MDSASISIIGEGEKKIAHVSSGSPILKDGQSALDLLATLNYNYDCTRMAIDKASVSEEFFRLGTGVAGEVTQKFVNYGCKAAIIGDFSGYKSKPLKDFIYESNNGLILFFVSTLEEAVQRLGKA
ncbi:MAG: DUF4180 domain-containing protein [Clostridiales bacterium]|jgi:hypothetical protein|nr:DUF4180 domain-containing protein [Clostridiales bacterium]